MDSYLYHSGILWSSIMFMISLGVIVRDLDADCHASPSNFGALYSFAFTFLLALLCSILAWLRPNFYGHCFSVSSITSIILAWLFTLGPLFSFRSFPVTSMLKFLLLVPSVAFFYIICVACMYGYRLLQQRQQQQYGPPEMELAVDVRQP